MKSDLVVEHIGKIQDRPLANGDVLRAAAITDARQIHFLVNSYADKGLMLPRSLRDVLEHIRDFIVVERDGEIQGCAALHILWKDLAEIRSLAVRKGREGEGLGRELVQALLNQAAVLGLPSIFALTYQRRFFERLGFEHIDKGELPRKIWMDCVNCPKFPDCDEEAVMIRGNTDVAHPRSDGLRKALVGDVDEIAAVVNYHASRGRMLPRSRNHIYQNLPDFVVFVEDGHVLACGALHVLWDDLGEMRAVAVAPDRVGQGLGSTIVQGLVEEGRRLGLPRVFAFTYEQGFFERFGLRLVPRESLPRKVWGECLDCPKFPNCDELAMVLDL